jgi:hypothetical protein
MDDDPPPYEFTEVKPSGWNKNKNKKSSSLTPIPTYYPTTQWPTYSPTTVEDKAEWLRKKQKYLKNRDKVPDSVWESDEASASKKEQLWLEKQKEHKQNSDNEESNNEEAASSVKQEQQQEEGTNPTPTPTYYDPPVVPTKKQKQLEKQREKLAAPKHNTTNTNEASDSFTPSSAPTVLDSSDKTYSPSSSSIPTISDTNSPSSSSIPKRSDTYSPSSSSIPTINSDTYSPSSSSIPTISNIPTQEVPTRKQQKKAKEQAQLAAGKLNNNSTAATKTQEPSDSPIMSSRYTGGSREPPKSRKPPASRSSPEEESSDEAITEEVEETKGNDETADDDAAALEEEATEESEPQVLETIIEESEPDILETNEKPEKNNDDKISSSSPTPSGKQLSKKKSTSSEKVSLILKQEELEKIARDAPKPTSNPTPNPTPTPAPVKKTTSVKVSLTFVNNRAKKKLTPAPTASPTPFVTSSEPTYLLFPTILPTEPHPTYAPTEEWTWAPTVNKDRKNKPTDKSSLFDKRTCPSDNLFFESESHTEEENSGKVFFTYGIQTSKDGDIEEAVQKIQLWLMEDVASKLLHCSKNGFVMRSNNDFGNNKDGQGGGVLSSVYYSKDDRQYATECNPTTSNANVCAIVSSTLRFDAVEQEMQARSKVLAVIFNQIQSGFDARLEEVNILDLVYLGPELGYQQIEDVEVKDTSTSSSSSPTRMYAAIGVASFAVFALLLCLTMSYKLRKERRRRVPSVASSYRDSVASSYRDSAASNYRDVQHHDGSYSYTSSGSRRSYYR